MHILILTGFALLVCFPVLMHGLPDMGNDCLDHTRWTRNFDRQLWQGEWYPRWLPDLNAGFGSPIFFFYPPLPFYASAMFWPMLHNVDPEGWFTMGLSCVLSFVLAAIAAYFWCRALADPDAALFGGLIYTLLPYHLATNLYTRASASELWAVVWLPLILLAVYRLTQGSRWAFPALVISYALLVTNHIPTTICFSLAPLGLALYLSEPGRKMSAFLKTVAGMTLGAGLAAVFLLPVLLEEKSIDLSSLVDDPFYTYRRWWLTGIHPLFDSRTRLLLLTLATVGYLGVVFWMCWRSRPADPKRRMILFHGAVAIGTLFMTTQLSAPIWSALSVLRSMQFPTRFLNAFVVVLPGLSAMAFQSLRQRPWRLPAVIAGLFILSWIAATGWAIPMAYIAWRPIAPDKVREFEAYKAFRKDTVAYARDGMWPRWTRAKEVSEFPAFPAYVAAHTPRSAQLVGALSGKPVGSVTIESWAPRRAVLNLDEPEPGSLTVNHFYYPGWIGRIEGSGELVPVGPSRPDGFLQMDVPKGNYRLVLDLEREWPERLGIYLSLCSLLLTAAIVTWLGSRPRAV